MQSYRATTSSTSSITEKLANFKINPGDIKISIRLGNGASGEIFLGKWKNENVAIKKIPNDFVGRHEELSILCTISKIPTPSKYIMKFFGYFENDAAQCLVTEYLSKGDMFDYLLTNPNINVLLLHKISLQVAYGVEYLHANGIYHRDIKPENIMLDADLNAKLIDFGFAIKKEDAIHCSACGTPAYAAPEIYYRLPFSEKSDIYSCAITFYTFYAQANAYDSKLTSDGIMEKAINNIRPVIPVKIPSKIAELITWGWEHEPLKRPNASDVVTYMYDICQKNNIVNI